jgi:hypothetical protein
VLFISVWSIGVFRTNSYVVFTHNVICNTLCGYNSFASFENCDWYVRFNTATNMTHIYIYIYIYMCVCVCVSICKWNWNCEGERRLLILVIPWQLPLSKIIPFFHTYLVCDDNFCYTLSSVLKFDHCVLSGREGTKQILVIRTRFLKKYWLWGTNGKLY